MTEKKIVAIVGATGGQGGGLARAILHDPSGGFSVRALTRRTGSDPALALARHGAEVVFADLDRVETLKRALDGAYAAFCVTNFWEHRSADRELAQARAIAHSAACAGTEHVIWSTLEDTRQWIPPDGDRMPTLLGRFNVPHFDAKGEANSEFTRLNVPTTFQLTSFYWDNFIGFPGMAPRRDASGVLTLAMPMGDKRLPGIAVEDIGRCAYGILRAGRVFIGQTVGIAGEHLTGLEIASALSRSLGQPVRYADVPPDVYRGLNIPRAEELANMFQFKRDFQDLFCGARSVERSRRLNPLLQSFEQWLADNGRRIRID